MEKIEFYPCRNAECNQFRRLEVEQRKGRFKKKVAFLMKEDSFFSCLYCKHFERNVDLFRKN